MAARTVMIHGSDKVMAMFSTPGTFYEGKWERVRVTGVSKDEDVPLEIRTALVGLTVPTIFTKESIEDQTGTSFPITEGTRLAYSVDVIEALRSAGKTREADLLGNVAGGSLDMYTVEPGVYEMVRPNP